MPQTGPLNDPTAQPLEEILNSRLIRPVQSLRRFLDSIPTPHWPKSSSGSGTQDPNDTPYGRAWLQQRQDAATATFFPPAKPKPAPAVVPKTAPKRVVPKKTPAKKPTKKGN